METVVAHIPQAVAALVAAALLVDRFAVVRVVGDRFGCPTTGAKCRVAAVSTGPAHSTGVGHVDRLVGAPADDTEAESELSVGGWAPVHHLAHSTLSNAQSSREGGSRGLTVDSVRRRHRAEELTMPKFMIQGTYSQAGLKGVLTDGGSGRVDAVRKTAESLGGHLDSFYFAFGDEDTYVICDLPDNKAAAALALTIGASGGVTTKTTPLLTPEDVDRATKAKVDYQAPGR
jgi:uncharacterized protein with GYD domain